VDIVAKYVAQVLTILREKQAVAEQIAQLDKLSETLGLTEYDLAYLEKQFEDGLRRGQGYIRYKQWGKAIYELEQVILLKPLHTEGLYQIANAYKHQYRKTSHEADRKKALYYAERCLQTDAGKEEALALVGELQNRWLKWQSWTKRNSLWIFLIFLVLMAGVGYWYLLPSEKEIVQQNQLYAQKQEISLELDAKLAESGIHFDKETSFARMEQASLAYHLRGHCWHETDEYTHFEVELQLLDKAGKLLKTQDLLLLDEQAFELRPKDNLPLSALLQLPKQNVQIGKARLVGKKIAHQKPENPYETSKTLALKNNEQIAEKGLEIVERYQTIKPSPDTFEHTICLAYRHHSAKPIRSWRIELQWQDRQERLIHTETWTLVAPQEPLLKTQKWRTQTFHTKVPLKQKDFGRYQVLILSVD
jgi:hypothetical protein